MPQVLLVRRTVALDVAWSEEAGSWRHEVAGVAATDAGRLHPTVGGEVGRTEGEALHPGRGAADLLDVDHAARGLEDRVHQDRPLQPGLGLELGEQPVDVVDVLGALHLRDHHHVELVADLGDQGGQVVEPQGESSALTRVHAGLSAR